MKKYLPLMLFLQLFSTGVNAEESSKEVLIKVCCGTEEPLDIYTVKPENSRFLGQIRFYIFKDGSKCVDRGGNIACSNGEHKR